MTAADLARYDGSNPAEPIYVAIKGRIFDVSAKRDMYGKGTGYNVFAGKDASKGLGGYIMGLAELISFAGMSSLDPSDAIPDYSTLTPTQRQTLDQWESFFEKVSRTRVLESQLTLESCSAIQHHRYS
jgi:membrane-associated progesterone receptor component